MTYKSSDVDLRSEMETLVGVFSSPQGAREGRVAFMEGHDRRVDVRDMRILVHKADDLIGFVDVQDAADIYCLFGETYMWRDLKYVSSNFQAVRDKALKWAKRENNAWVLCPSKWVCEICKLNVVRYANNGIEINAGNEDDMRNVSG